MRPRVLKDSERAAFGREYLLTTSWIRRRGISHNRCVILSYTLPRHSYCLSTTARRHIYNIMKSRVSWFIMLQMCAFVRSQMHWCGNTFTKYVFTGVKTEFSCSWYWVDGAVVVMVKDHGWCHGCIRIVRMNDVVMVVVIVSDCRRIVWLILPWWCS